MCIVYIIIGEYLNLLRNVLLFLKILWCMCIVYLFFFVSFVIVYIWYKRCFNKIYFELKVRVKCFLLRKIVVVGVSIKVINIKFMYLFNNVIIVIYIISYDVKLFF